MEKVEKVEKIPLADDFKSFREFSALREKENEEEEEEEEEEKEKEREEEKREKEKEEEGTIYYPFFIKEEYSGRDNKTKLNKNYLEMLVEIIGFYHEPPLIFPFGSETKLPAFKEMTIEMEIKDAEDSMNGTMFGILKRRKDGVYFIKMTELYTQDGEASSIEKYTLPLTLTCSIYLEYA